MSPLPVTADPADIALDDLVRSWEAQQAAYVAQREQRFEVMLDIVELAAGDGQVLVLDLACGTGSLSRRVLERFQQARVLAVDLDPVLLAVADHNLAEFGTRCRIGEADLADERWIAALAGETPTVAMSTTALHWLPAPALIALYAQLADLLPQGGLFVNGDHLRFDSTVPTLIDLAARHDTATQSRARVDGALTWDEWWARAAAHPWLAELMPERARRFADRPAQPPTTIAFHLAALRQAGFAEASTVWQLFDDYIAVGRR